MKLADIKNVGSTAGALIDPAWTATHVRAAHGQGIVLRKCVTTHNYESINMQ